MATKPTYEELEHRVKELEGEAVKRQRAEEALRRERDFTSAVLSTAGALVVVLNREGRIVRFNKACQQLTGYSFEEVRDRYVWDLFLIPDEVEPVKAVFRELRSGQFRNEHENYWVARDGTRRLIMWSNTTLLDQQGSVEHVIGTGIDITGRKQAEQERMERERLQGVLEMAGAVSHEFNQPLQSVLGFSDLLMMEIQEDSPLYGYAKAIKTQVERMGESTKKLLTIKDQYEATLYPNGRRINVGETLKEK